MFAPVLVICMTDAAVAAAVSATCAAIFFGC
jgi:hypothetical protein